MFKIQPYFSFAIPKFCSTLFLVVLDYIGNHTPTLHLITIQQLALLLSILQGYIRLSWRLDKGFGSTEKPEGQWWKREAEQQSELSITSPCAIIPHGCYDQPGMATNEEPLVC